MPAQYYCTKKTLLILPLVFISLLLHAQSEQETDTTRLLSQDIDGIADSLGDPPPQEITVDDQYEDETAGSSSTYFLNKQLQVSGGGPDTIQPRKVPDSVIKKLQEDDDFWYANYIFEKAEKKENEIPLTRQPGFQIILWLVIIGGFAAFVILYLANSNVNLFRKKSKAIGAGDDIDVETDNIFEINYQREIDKAVSNSNYRLAVRLMFLRVLKNLSDKKIIQYKQDRTNFDYLLQIHSTKYYPDFFRITRNYEYSWYGQFDIEPEKFAIIKNDFENFDRNLNSR
jgi:hypothetical protein